MTGHVTEALAEIPWLPQTTPYPLVSMSYLIFTQLFV